MRLELTRANAHYPLKVARLPIPPPGLSNISRAKNGTRTRDPDLGKVVLYQLSYFRICRYRHTITNLTLSLSEKRDSNPRPRPWQGRALPTELFSHLPLPAYPITNLFNFLLSEKRDSNPRPRPWQGRALPTELFSRSYRGADPLLRMQR